MKKCCGNCWHFAEYTEEHRAKSGYDGCCLFGTPRSDDRPRMMSDYCDLWKKIHGDPTCDNCDNCVDMGGGDFMCGVGIPVLVKEDGKPTACYRAGSCPVWASKEEKTNEPFFRKIRLL